MKKFNKNIEVFFTLLQAGLWEKEVWLSQFGNVDFNLVFNLAQEQSLIGLLAAGIEHVKDVKIPKNEVLLFVGETLQLEQRNKAMNGYLAKLMRLLRNNQIYALLVKGQGVAQCYERPMWRAAGDIDLLLYSDNYELAKVIMAQHAIKTLPEYKPFKHIGYIMDHCFEVELHGTMHNHLSKRINRVIDVAQDDVFKNGYVRVWRDGDTDVYIPAPDTDVIFLFTHILHHFYMGGIGLRQICDWCRFLWTYRDSLDIALLERRLRSMGLMTEWHAFAAMAVDWLGMPAEAMPLYCDSAQWSRKGARIMAFVLECGNFGRNRKSGVAPAKSYFGRKFRSLWRKVLEFGRHMRLFPLDSVRFFWHFFWDGVAMVTRGE